MKYMAHRCLSALIASALTAITAHADPVWHCSRNKYDEHAAIQTPSPENQFSIAASNSSAEVIGVSVSDLIDIYTGQPVRLGGLPLAGCFLVGNESMTTSALTSLGIKLQTIEALARKNSIVQSNLYYVNSEAQMGACISKNSPAVGYLSVPTETNGLMPCF